MSSSSGVDEDLTGQETADLCGGGDGAEESGPEEASDGWSEEGGGQSRRDDVPPPSPQNSEETHDESAETPGLRPEMDPEDVHLEPSDLEMVPLPFPLSLVRLAPYTSAPSSSTPSPTHSPLSTTCDQELLPGSLVLSEDDEEEREEGTADVGQQRGHEEEFNAEGAPVEEEECSRDGEGGQKKGGVEKATKGGGEPESFLISHRGGGAVESEEDRDRVSQREEQMDTAEAVIFGKSPRTEELIQGRKGHQKKPRISGEGDGKEEGISEKRSRMDRESDGGDVGTGTIASEDEAMTDEEARQVGGKWKIGGQEHGEGRIAEKKPQGDGKPKAVRRLRAEMGFH